MSVKGKTVLDVGAGAGFMKTCYRLYLMLENDS
jgi:predicted nicotinamide N-methyase